MKKLIFCLAIALTVFSVASFAQQGGGGAERFKQALKDSLQFSDVKIDSIMAVRAQFQPQMREIFSDQSMSQDDKRAKMADLNTQMKARYKAFLSDDEIAKLDAYQQRMRGQGRPRNNR